MLTIVNKKKTENKNTNKRMLETFIFIEKNNK